MDNPLLKTFLKDIFSLPQARRRLNVLKTYFDEKFFNLSTNGSYAVSPEDGAWLKLLPEAFLKNFNKLNCHKLIDSLKIALAKIEPLIIYLPTEIPDTETDEIGKWLRKNTSQTIFDTKLNPSLLGGCAFAFKGTLKDYSLKVAIDAQREKILSAMKGYLK